MIWEPTRYCILRLRKKHAGLNNVRKRLKYAVFILVPYAFFIGFFRIYLEDATNIWNVPVAHISNYSYTIGITLLFILLELAAYESLYFFDQWSKSLAETEELKRINFQIQLDSLKVQIQPHFLFNTLNTLIGLIEADSGRAITFTENLAFVYRYLLQANERSLINLKEELHFTTIYFSLLKTRYPDGLFLHQAISDMENFDVPPLSLHILIENAVKHGIASLGSDGRITIAIFRNNDDLTLKIEDNGKGFDTSRSYDGLGFNLSTKRIALLNKIYKKDPILLNMESQPGKTIVSIILTKWL
ncbi:MAG: hypothetical protein EOO43_18705 [Flavobacterium sp.]|nr:MAG: hypothetical protein EOO43_18705 [Flavobacterium sp.]